MVSGINHHKTLIHSHLEYRGAPTIMIPPGQESRPQGVWLGSPISQVPMTLTPTLWGPKQAGTADLLTTEGNKGSSNPLQDWQQV